MSKCPVVLCSIEGRSSNFIVDTGSQVSIIPISLVRKWGLKLIEDKRLSNLRTANGSKLITMGVVQVDAFMWNKKFKDVIFVVTHIDSLCIIGMNILEKFEYVWLGDKETKLKEIISRKVNRVESNSLDVAYIGLKGGSRKQVEQLIIKYRAGKQNIVADALSRKQDSNSEVEDSNNMYEEDLDVRHVEVG